MEAGRAQRAPTHLTLAPKRDALYTRPNGSRSPHKMIIDLSLDIERRIADLAAKHGRSSVELISSLIMESLIDHEDRELAREQLAEPGARKSLQILECELGLDRRV